MKTYWLNNDKKREDYFKTYAAAFDRTIIPEDALVTLVAQGEEVCGFSALDIDGDTADILFFLIREEYRRHGLGTFLLKDISQKLSGMGIGALWAALPSDAGLIAFFEAAGFDIFPGEEEYVTTFGELCTCEKYKRDIANHIVKGVIPFKECTPPQRTEIQKSLAENGIDEPRGYDMDLSFAAFRGGALNSLLLCERVGGGIIVRLMRVTRSGDPADLLHCLRAFDERLSGEEKSASLKLSFPADQEGNRKLIEFLTGFDIQIEKVTRGYIACTHMNGDQV